MKFVELSFSVSSDALVRERLGDALVEAGAQGFEERADALVVWLPPEMVDGFLAQLPEEKPTQVLRDEDEWRDTWKAFFKTRKVADFVLVPSWERYSPTAGEIVLDFDPGRAFGTGGHASTRLCLALLSRIAQARPAGFSPRFADIGCGSGILAIACALRYGSARGLGIDIDAESIDVSRENAKQNKVSERIDFSTTPIARIQGTYDIVFANIQPEVLIPMAPELCARLAPGGDLLLSGILEEAAPPVEATYRALGLTVVDRALDEGWIALQMRSA